MISPKLNFLEFLTGLAEMDRMEIIRTASRERRAATDITVKRGTGAKAKYQKIREYGSDLGDFLQFLHTTGDHEIPLPEAYLASTEWQNKQRARGSDV